MLSINTNLVVYTKTNPSQYYNIKIRYVGVLEYLFRMFILFGWRNNFVYFMVGIECEK